MIRLLNQIIYNLLLMDKLKVIDVECKDRYKKIKFIECMSKLKEHIKKLKLKLKITMDHNNLMKLTPKELDLLIKEYRRRDCMQSINLPSDYKVYECKKKISLI